MKFHSHFLNIFARTGAMAALVLLLVCGAALASDDHGHDHGAPAATGTASPRLLAHSDLFELVGIVDKGQMTIYLDRYATNEPVLNAKLEYESGQAKGIAEAQSDGTYLVKFDALAKPGQLPFSFIVTAGADTDLLAGDLELKEPHEEPHSSPRNWRALSSYVLAGAFALALSFFLLRRFRSMRNARLKG